MHLPYSETWHTPSETFVIGESNSPVLAIKSQDAWETIAISANTVNSNLFQFTWIAVSSAVRATNLSKQEWCDTAQQIILHDR